MHTQKTNRPAFQSVDLDPMDLRLEAKAAEKGIPTLVSPPIPAAPSVTARRRSRAGDTSKSTPRGRMKTLNIEVPDYAWIAIKTRAAQQMVSVRHIIMAALRASGVDIKDADMIEDGRRLRGPEAGPGSAELL
jgi:hypothetical protein